MHRNFAVMVALLSPVLLHSQQSPDANKDLGPRPACPPVKSQEEKNDICRRQVGYLYTQRLYACLEKLAKEESACAESQKKWDQAHQETLRNAAMGQGSREGGVVTQAGGGEPPGLAVSHPHLMNQAPSQSRVGIQVGQPIPGRRTPTMPQPTTYKADGCQGELAARGKKLSYGLHGGEWTIAEGEVGHHFEIAAGDILDRQVKTINVYDEFTNQTAPKEAMLLKFRRGGIKYELLLIPKDRHVSELIAEIDKARNFK